MRVEKRNRGCRKGNFMWNTQSVLDVCGYPCVLAVYLFRCVCVCMCVCAFLCLRDVVQVVAGLSDGVYFQMRALLSPVARANTYTQQQTFAVSAMIHTTDCQIDSVFTGRAR